MTVDTPHITSFSAFEDLAKCGHLYELKRVFRRPERPGVVAVAGSAFHRATEHVDRGEAVNFADVFASFIEEREKETEIPRRQWVVSGRKSKDKPFGETIEVWADMGQTLLEDYKAWRLSTKWRIATGLPDCLGTDVGIEYPLAPEIGGHVRKAFIDRIMFDADGNLGIVDIKTGARKPNSLQLPVYAAKLAAIGVRVQWGAYYMARKGGHTPPRMLRLTPTELAEVYATADEIVERRLFVPRVSPDCEFCWMREHCVYNP